MQGWRRDQPATRTRLIQSGVARPSTTGHTSKTGNQVTPSSSRSNARKPRSKIIGLKELTYEEYQNGYEWWLPLEVAKMVHYKEEWPYAAVQVKIQFVHGVPLQGDPFMMNAGAIKPKSTFCEKWCWNCCLPCRMACYRCSWVCAMTTWVNTKWCCLMTMVTCYLGCAECCTLCTYTWDWCTGKQSLRDLRRTCAKKYRLADADDDDDDGVEDTACCCVPLRTAVFLISVLSTVNAMVAFFFPRLLSDSDYKAGGYSVQSRVVVGATQITGVFFGPIGCLGAYELNVSLLNTYNYYQLLRLGGMFFMFYTDIPLLADCNLWRTDLNAAIKQYGWNPAMYQVAMGNSCLQAQIDFALAAFFSLVIYTYLISLTRRLIWDTEQTPRYLLAMPRDTPNGSFVKFNRTQGRSKPPYGSILGDAAPMGPKGKLESTTPGQQRNTQGLVGPPVMMPQVPGAMPPGGMGPQNFRY